MPPPDLHNHSPLARTKLPSLPTLHLSLRRPPTHLRRTFAGLPCARVHTRLAKHTYRVAASTGRAQMLHARHRRPRPAAVHPQRSLPLTCRRARSGASSHGGAPRRAHLHPPPSPLLPPLLPRRVVLRAQPPSRRRAARHEDFRRCLAAKRREERRRPPLRPRQHHECPAGGRAPDCPAPRRHRGHIRQPLG